MQADCPNLVTFYGAFYRDAQISIGLELMDAGSLEDILRRVGKFPEAALAIITVQVFGTSYHPCKWVVFKSIFHFGTSYHPCKWVVFKSIFHIIHVNGLSSNLYFISSMLMGCLQIYISYYYHPC